MASEGACSKATIINLILEQIIILLLPQATLASIVFGCDYYQVMCSVMGAVCASNKLQVYTFWSAFEDGSLACVNESLLEQREEKRMAL